MKSFVTTSLPPISWHLQSVCSAAAVRKRAFISTQHEVCDDSIHKSIDTPSTCLITLALNTHSRPCLPRLKSSFHLEFTHSDEHENSDLRLLLYTQNNSSASPGAHAHTVNLLNSVTVEPNDAVWLGATLNQWSSSD